MAMQLSQSGFFNEKKLVPYNIGKETIMIYPSLAADMSLAEKAHAFNINKNALENIHLPTKIYLRQLGDILGCGPVVSFHAAKFREVAYEQLKSGLQASATTYHKANGHIIQDTTNVERDNEIKPLENNSRDIQSLRADGICFARLHSILNFASLDPEHKTNYRFSYFHVLPVAAKTITMHSGVTPRRVQFHRTFLGPVDWATSTDDEIIAENWKHATAIEDPFDLVEPNIRDTNSDAEINIRSAISRLENIYFEAAAGCIKKAIFEKCCPSYTDDPTAAILKIQQIVPDNIDPSKHITLDVATYHSRTLRLMEQLGVHEDFKIDVVQHFFQNLAPKVKDQVKVNGYIDDTKVHSRKPFDQFNALNKLFHKAVQAEYQLKRESNTIKEIMNSHSTFMTQPSAYVSTAERAIKSYKETKVLNCWGCGGDHSWWNAQLKKVVCPQADDPKAQANAAAKFEEYKKKRESKTKTSKKKKRIETIFTEVLAGVDTEDDEAIRNRFQQAFVSKSDSAPSSPIKRAKAEASSSSLILIYNVLTSPTDLKPHLDIPVFKCLPHFSFHVGKLDSDFHPQLFPAYDTCAALNCGYLPYHTAIAKAYPELVKDIKWAGKEFAPIMLQGVVQDESKANDVTTALVAVIEYYTPYTTSGGCSTTLKIALGNDVAANIILGIATIKAAGLTLDLQDDVITSGVLDNFGPTKVVFKNTARGLPNSIPKDENSGNLSLHFKEIYEKACHIEKAAIVNDKENSVSVNTTVVSEATENSKPKEEKELKSILKSPSLKKLNFDLASDSSLGYF